MRHVNHDPSALLQGEPPTTSCASQSASSGRTAAVAEQAASLMSRFLAARALGMLDGEIQPWASPALGR